MLKAPFSWPGGKSNLRSKLLPFIPAHAKRTESVWLDPATAAEVLPAAQQRLQLAPAAG